MEKLTGLQSYGDTADDSIRVALLHAAFCYDDVWRNVESLEALIRKAMQFQPDIILTPELAISGYEFYKVLGGEWIGTDGPKIVDRFCRLAHEHQVALVLGSPVYDEKSEKFYNAALFIDEQGDVLGAHYKVNVLPGSEGWSSRGTEIQTVSWRGQTIGLLICADAYTETIAVELAHKGANVLVSPAAWATGLHGPDREWEQRSKETGLCLLVCNRTGRESALNFEGSSSAIIADGQRLVEYAGKQAAILVMDLERQTWRPRSKAFIVFDASGLETSLEKRKAENDDA